MKKIFLATILLCISSLALAEKVPVTSDNYEWAESDFSFNKITRIVGSNKWFHFPRLTPLDNQTVVRMNRDTIYSGYVADLSQGGTVTIPEVTDGRYLSVMIVQNDHYISQVFTTPGVHEIKSDTEFVMIVARIQVDENDSSDINVVKQYQAQLKVDIKGIKSHRMPEYDMDQLLALRAKLVIEGSKLGSLNNMQGARGSVDKHMHQLGTALGWGLLPDVNAQYLSYFSQGDIANADHCFAATYQKPPMKKGGFFSITVYSKAGWIVNEHAVINSSNIIYNADDTFTVHYGNCDKRLNNRLSVENNWDMLFRVYKPISSKMKSYQLPKPAVFNTGLTKVNKANFIIAETDKYFTEHVKNHPVNTIRHSRKMSSKDNQFVIRENQDVLYSHAVVDISQGATLANPAWDEYSIIQVIDEEHYTIGVVYPGETLELTPEMANLGHHVFLNIRTGVRTFDEKDFTEAHQHQNQIKITAHSATPYVSKGFDRVSLNVLRSKLEKRKTEITKPWLMFGNKGEVDMTSFLIASAGGWGGLPAQHASYIVTVQPSRALSASAKCAVMNLPVPPLKYAQGGFFSVTAYDKKGWIATDPFALNNKQAQANEDGSYTFHFNCSGAINNIKVPANWSALIRLYMPNSLDEILDYTARVNKEVAVVKM